MASKYTDQKVAADAEAIALSGTSQTAAARDEAQSATSHGIAAKDSAVTLAGTGNNLNVGGLNLGAENRGTIILNDQAGVLAVSQSYQDTVRLLSESRDKDAENYAKIIEGQTEQNADLAEGKQTDGAVPVGKLLLWGVAILALAWASAKWFTGRKSA